MRETLHIFAKDSRHLWIPILLTIGALVFFVNASLAVLPVYELALRDTWGVGIPFLVARYSPFILVVAWGYLIAQVVFAEALHGDRQFWLTRPYSRSALLASKLLFILVWVNLPLAVAQAAILGLSGYSLLTALPGLLWAHVLIYGLLAAPLAALAAMSVSLSWLVATFVPLAFAIAFILGDSVSLQRLAWVRFSALAVFGQMVVAAVLLVQYRYRRTTLARAIVALGIVGAFGVSRAIDWSAAFSVQQWVQGESASGVTATLARPLDRPVDDSSQARTSTAFVAAPGGVWVPLSFTVNGAAPDAVIGCEASRVTLTTRSGHEWRDAVRITAGSRLEPAVAGCTGLVMLPRNADEFLAEPVSVDADLYVTVFNAAQRVEVPLAARRPVPGLGECAADTRVVQTAAGETWRFADVACDTPFRTPSVSATLNAQNTLWPASRPSYAPWPADVRLQPIERLTRTLRTEGASVWVETRSILAHTRLRVVAADVDLMAHRAIPAR